MKKKCIAASFIHMSPEVMSYLSLVTYGDMSTTVRQHGSTHLQPVDSSSSMEWEYEHAWVLCSVAASFIHPRSMIQHRTYMYIYRTALLLHPAHCYARPPFREKLLYRVILPPLHAPPPAGLSSWFVVHGTAVLARVTRVASVEELYSCIKHVENILITGSWPFSLILDGFLRPVILHVILPCSLAVGGRSLAARLPAMFEIKWQHVRGQQLFHPSVLPRHVDRRSSRLLPHNTASLISVREFVGVGGG